MLSMRILRKKQKFVKNCCNDKTNGLQIKFSASKVSLVCNGKSKQHKGYTFKYEE